MARHHSTIAFTYDVALVVIAYCARGTDADLKRAGVPGYAGGVNAQGDVVRWKSSEHNADVAGFYRGLAAAGESEWAGRADVAGDFLDAMWDRDHGAFWTGTGNDGRTVNRTPVPEDPQTWSCLVHLGGPAGQSVRSDPMSQGRRTTRHLGRAGRQTPSVCAGGR
ncbi:hypothetical protein ACYSUO_01245 [Streptomyces sp. UC4497]